ncbi:MAG: glycosyltransferase [Bacilli bacterium]|nr:glycosyltransferase [Bacilli bacterium]
MKKITIIALHLGYGGIEKAVINLANELSSSYDVKILSIYKLYDEVPFEVNSNVNIKYLMSGNIALKTDKYKRSIKSLKFITLFKQLFKDYHFNIFRLAKDTVLSVINVINKRKLVRNYIKNSNDDIFISTRDFINKVVGSSKKDSQIGIGWEHNHHNNNKKYFNKICNSVKNLNYFVLVSNDLYNDYNKVLSNTSCKCVYIPNMISINNPKLSKLNNNNLITVSRLSKEKGIFDLIDVIGLVKEKIDDIHLNLIGDGPLFNDVLNYVNEKGLGENIHLLGYRPSNDVYEYLSNSALYVMTSFTESFGIVLLEAFSFGVPAIAFDSANGACQLINNDNGILISNRDKEAMANSIIKYLKDDDLKKILSKGTQNGLQKYAPECIIISWKELFR